MKKFGTRKTLLVLGVASILNQVSVPEASARGRLMIILGVTGVVSLSVCLVTPECRKWLDDKIKDYTNPDDEPIIVRPQY